MLDKQSLLLRKASITTVLGVVATVVWMMVANVGLRGGENAAVDSAAGMISQAVAVALFTMPLVVFAIVHLYVSEEQEFLAAPGLPAIASRLYSACKYRR